MLYNINKKHIKYPVAQRSESVTHFKNGFLYNAGQNGFSVLHRNQATSLVKTVTENIQNLHPKMKKKKKCLPPRLSKSVRGRRRGHARRRSARNRARLRRRVPHSKSAEGRRFCRRSARGM